MVCDWLLTTRTELWEKNCKEEGATASQTEMIAFQQDLNSLRKLAQTHKNILSKVLKLNITNISSVKYCLDYMQDFRFHVPMKMCWWSLLYTQVFLHEATARMMAGASPARTQQLLDRSIRRRHTSKADKGNQELFSNAQSLCFLRYLIFDLI